MAEFPKQQASTGVLGPPEPSGTTKIKVEMYRPSKLARMLLDNAQARTGALLREHRGEIQVEVLAFLDSDDVQLPRHLPLDLCDVVSREIIRYVSRTGETVVLGDARRDERFSSDPHLRRETPLSVVCVPIIHLGRRIGILYLENDRMADAFAGDKLDKVAVISAYAATAIENAHLHRHLLDSERFFQAATDALPANLAILDLSGKIIRVNDDWRRFADANGFQYPDHGVGMNYLEVCDRAAQRCAEAKGAAAGIGSVIEHKCDDFYLDYSCHSPTQKRWFQMRVRSFTDRNAERLLWHTNR
ncbi:MAG: GAF domain-containing protein [Candidatus Binataceae bacterium]